MAKQQQQRQQRRAIALGDTALGSVEEIKTVDLAPGFAISPNGLVVKGRPSFEKCEYVGELLRIAEKASPFAIGDYALYIEDALGERASQILDAESGWNLRTLSVYRWMADRIKLADRRMDRLGVRHHLLVAPLAKVQQRKWLTAAAADEDEKPWTVARLKVAMEAGEDQPIDAFFVIVACPSGQAQDELVERLTAEGLACKASVRHRRKKMEVAA